ncbi:GTP-binding protein [Streptosporangium sp. NPDC002721]|uniref:GTP-binding protein n=1 Tax=Streptosporangium sp. NPDC002721 TaxID=3366188 RepID=UPI0036C27CE8
MLGQDYGDPVSPRHCRPDSWTRVRPRCSTASSQPRGGARGVIGNDMSEISLDAGQVRNGVFPSHTGEGTVEITDDCVCCTLRDDLLKEAGRSAAGSRRVAARPWFLVWHGRR